MTLHGDTGHVVPPDTGQIPAVPGAPPPPPVNLVGSNGAVPEGPTPVPNRLQKLASMVDSARRGRSDRDIRKIMHVVGMAVLVFGFVAILLGWYGASHSPYLFQEVPYLISGGLLGLALVIAGGVLVRCAWSLRQIEEARRNTGAMVRAVERLESAIRILQAEPGLDDHIHEELRQ
jgi:hypothetical protein